MKGIVLMFWFLGYLKAQSLVLSGEDDYSVLGEQFTFTCRITGSGNVDSIQFRKDGSSICIVILESCQPSRPPKYSCGCSPNNIYEAQITIMEISLEDGATWSCQDFTNSAVLSNLINLPVYYPPTITTNVTISHDNNGKYTAVLLCSVKSKPGSNITWSSESNDDITIQGSTFTVHDVVCGTVHQYTCTANNGIGSPASDNLIVFTECSETTQQTTETTSGLPITITTTPNLSTETETGSTDPKTTEDTAIIESQTTVDTSGLPVTRTSTPNLSTQTETGSIFTETTEDTTIIQSDPTVTTHTKSTTPSILSSLMTSAMPVMTTSAGLTTGESPTPSSNQMSQQGLSTEYIVIIVLGIVVVIAVVIGVVCWKRRKKDYREGDYLTAIGTARDTSMQLEEHQYQLAHNSTEYNTIQPDTASEHHYDELDVPGHDTSRNSVRENTFSSQPSAYNRSLGRPLHNDVNGDMSGGQGVNGDMSGGHGVNGDMSGGHGVNGDMRGGHDVNGDNSVGHGVNGDMSGGHGVNGDMRGGHDVNEDLSGGQGVNGDMSVGHGVNGDMSGGHGVNEDLSGGQGVNGDMSGGHGVNEGMSRGHGVNGDVSGGHGVNGDMSGGHGVNGDMSGGHGVNGDMSGGHGVNTV